MPSRPKTGGRRKGTPNRVTQEIGELARAHAPAAIKELARLAKAAESESARVSAIGMLLDRAYGKPKQAVQHSGAVGTYDLTKLSDEQINSLEAILGPLAIAGGDQGGEGA